MFVDGLGALQRLPRLADLPGGLELTHLLEELVATLGAFHMQGKYIGEVDGAGRSRA